MMPFRFITHSALEVDKVILLVDVKTLVAVSAVIIGYELVIDAIGLIVYMAVLHVSEYCQMRNNGVCCFHKTIVVSLVGIGVII